MATNQVPPDSNLVTPNAGSGAPSPVEMQVNGAAMLTVPFGPMLLTANFTRVGDDLSIQGRAGEQVVIQNYFGSEMAPMLCTEGGGRLTAEVVEALTGSSGGDSDLAGADGDATLIGQGAQPIGTVDTSEGEVYATRPDGSRVALKEGDPVFQGDVLETGDDGAIKVTFVDKTEFSLDQGARMVVDEMVYDAGSGDGKSAFTVVQGVFTFTSGMVAKAGPDAMQVHTPVATIGIRGTRVAIRAGAEGEDTVISLLQEEDGHTGEISITNDTGTRVLNVANQTVFVESAFAAPTQPIILPSAQLRAIFTRGNDDDRGYWRGETQGEQQGNAGGLEQKIQQAKGDVADEGHTEEKLEGAEAAAEIAFELALAEGKDEKQALEEAEKAFKDSLNEGKGADSLIQTAAGGEQFGGGLDLPGEQSGLEYDPNAGQQAAGPTGGTTTTTQTNETPETFVPQFQTTQQQQQEAGPIVGTSGSDTLTGTAGDDLIIAGDGDDVVDAGAGNDTVQGGGDDDVLIGGSGDDVVFGNDGDDLFLNAADNASDDVYDGGAGNDTVTYASDADGVYVDLNGGFAQGPGIGNDTLLDIENVTGGAGDDILIGNEDANVLVGGSGDDTVTIGAGDTADGGAGNDTVIISITSAQFQDPAFLQELKDYRNREGDGPFTFESIGSTVENFENLQLEVGGSLVVADTPYLEAMGASGDEDTAIALNIQAALNDVEGGEELAITIRGIPDGATISFNGQQILFTGEFSEVTFFATNQDQLDSLTITPPQDFNGEFSLEVSATAMEVDGTFSEVVTNLAVSVNPVNDNPVAIEVIQAGTEDAGALTGNLEATDIEGDPLTFAVDGADETGTVTTAAGALTVNPDGSYVFVPSGTIAIGEEVTENFTYTVSDGQGGSATSTISITITGTNNGPVAAEASVAGGEDDALLTGNLTATDPDAGAELTFGLAGSGDGQYGTISVNADGSYAFVINENAQGLREGETATEMFTYTVTDENGASSTATITVTLTGSNDGPVAEAAVVSGTEDDGLLTGNLTASDADLNINLNFTLNGSGEGQYGSLTVNPDGTYAFVLGENAQGLSEGQEVTETFTYMVTDEEGATSMSQITLTITGLNDAPVASSVSISGSEDAGTIAGNLVATDADADAQLSYELAGSGEGQYGTILVNGDGSYIFTVSEAAQGLAAGQEVTETFTYLVMDEQGAMSPATVTVTILGANDGPVAASASVSGTEDAGVLSGNLTATDADANAELTFSLNGDGEGSYGTIVVNQDGSYNFAVSEAAQSLGAGEEVTETFTYTVTDDQGETSTAQISVTVVGTNDAPVAASASVSGTEDAGILTGHLVATDPDASAALTFSLNGSGEGQYGAITVNEDGSYSFAVSESAQTLAAGQEVAETFTYTVTDDQGAKSMAQITVTILGSNDAPIASSASISGTEDGGALTGNLVATDVDANAELTYAVNGSGEGQYGTIVVNPDGSYSFAPNDSAQGLGVGQEATETFTYTVTDDQGETSTAQITVTIIGSNDGPVAAAASVSGTEDSGVLTGNLTATDVDANAELTFNVNGSGEGQYGTIVVNEDGSYSFLISEAAQSLAEGQVATETFTYTVTDENGATSTAQITVTIVGTNDAPVAAAASVSGTEDAGVLNGNLTATDVDANADLTFSLNGSGEGQYGAISVNEDGSYSFAVGAAAQGLAVGQEATETFTYTVTDDQGATSSAQITVTITGTNDAPVASSASVSGTEDAGTLSGNLVATDADANADLTFSLNGDGTGQYGAITVNADGSYSFAVSEAAQGLAVGQEATETFTYTVTDDQGATSTASITVTITGANDGPVAASASISGGEDDTALTGNLVATDVDANAELSFALNGSGEGQYGTLTVNTDGSYSFVPNAAAQGLAEGQVAQQSFTYTVTDDQGATSTATITVSLTGSNDGPVAEAESVSGTEDAPVLTGDLTAADADANADLSFSLNGSGESPYGTLVVNTDGSYSFAPNEAAQTLAEGQTAQQSFTYTVTDDQGATSTATITVTLTGSNDAPVAQAATVSGSEDAPSLSGNLVATDVDQGADLTYSLNGDGEADYGTMAVNADGSYSFTPNAEAQELAQGATVQQNFTFTVTDENGATSQNTITVTLTGNNDAPVAQAATISGGEDAPALTGQLVATDVDLGADLTYSLNGDGEADYGAITVNADGSYSFVPNEDAQSLAEGQTVQQNFTFTVTDEHGATATQTITVTLSGSNDAPVAQTATISGGEDAPVLSGNLVATDVDQGADLTFSLNGDGESQYGTMVINADGSYSFTPNGDAQTLADGQVVQQSFTFTVTDEHGATSQNTVTVTLTGSNDAPVAQAATISGGEDAPVLSGNLVATDVDQGAELTYSLNGDGEADYGTAAVNADGSYTFTPNAEAQSLAQGQTVQQNFTFTVTDEHGATSQQTLTVTLTGSNDAPVAQAATVSGSEDAPVLTGQLVATDVDQGADLTFALNGDGESDYGSIVVNEDGTYSFTPNEDAQTLPAGQTVQQSFTFTVTDEFGAASQQTITVTLTGSNDAPVAQAASVSGSEDAPALTGNLIATDVDGDDLTFALNGDGEADYGSIVVNADGSYSFTPNEEAQSLAQGQTVQQNFSYTVTDENGATSTATITVTLTGNNDAPVAQAATISGSEDAPALTGNLVATDVDQGADLTFSLNGAGESQYGTLTVNADGSYSFVPNEDAQTLAEGQTAQQSFTFTVTDENGATSQQTLTVTLTGSNDAPVAQAATVSGSEDAPALTGNLVATDVDQGADLTFALAGNGQSQYGTLAVNEDGSYTFTPNAAAQTLAEGQTAQQSFSFTVTDEHGAVSEQSLTVTLTGSNDAPVAQAATVSGSEDAPALTGNLIATDVDQGADLTFALNGDGQSQYGTLTVNENGSYSFAPNEAAQTLAQGQTAQQSFTFTVTDENGASAQQTLTVTLTGNNDAPVAQAATVSGGEDAPVLTGQLIATDVDQGAALTYALNGNGQGNYGTMVVNADGTYAFTPNDNADTLGAGQTANQTFTFTVSDGLGGTAQQTITVTLTGSNDGPVAQAATITGSENAPFLTGQLTAVDPDATSLTFALTGNGQGQYGTIAVNEDGSYSFKPNAAAQSLAQGQTATQSFTYTVTDDQGATSQATITVNLTGANDAPVALAEAVSGSEDAITLTGSLDATDVDQGASLTYALNSNGQSTYGQLTVNADGTYTFATNAAAQSLQNGQTVQQPFTYTVTDENGATSQNTIVVTLTGSNDAPVALAETVTGTENATSLTGSLDATDVDSTNLVFALVGNAGGDYGSIVVNGNGTYTFTPSPNAQTLNNGETAVQTYTYTVTDPQGAVSQNTITVTLTGSNDGPVAVAEVVAGSEDAGTLTGTLEATDVDSDTLTYAISGSNTGTYGTIAVNTDGTYTFTMKPAAQGLQDGQTVSQTFTYKVTDEQGAISYSTIKVNITGSNDAPVANATIRTGTEDVSSLTGNLSATDVDNASNTLTYTLNSDGAGQYGTLVVNPNGSYSFVPNANAQTLNVGQTGQQSFTFTVTDPQGATSQNTITIKLTGSNDVPVAQAEVVTGSEDAPTLTGQLDATDVDSATLTYALVGTNTGTYGSIVVNSNGTYTFTPNAAAQGLQDGQTATQTFSYKVTDTQGAISTQTITVTLNGSNDAPVGQAASISGSEDAASLTGQLVATDVDSTGLTFSLPAGTGAGQYGTLVVNANGSYTFTPNAAAQTLAAGQTAQQSFTYTVTDPQGGTAQNTISVTLTGSNDGPVAQATTVTGSEDAPSLTGNLVATDVDQGSTLTYALSGTGQSTYGTLVVGSNGAYTFTPNAAAQGLQDGQTATQSFTYTVSDGQGGTSQNTITINLTGANDAPVAQAASVRGGEDSTSLSGMLFATDVDSTNLTYALSSASQTTYGTMTVNADGSYSFVPNAAAQALGNGQMAQQSFTYTVTDPQGGTSQNTITVTVVGQNDAPVIQAVTKAGSEDAASITGALTATDAESQAVTFALSSPGAAQYGTLVVNTDGTYAFTPNAAAQGMQAGQSWSQQYTYTATDTQGGVSQQTITITLNGANDAPVAVAATVSGSEDAASLTGQLVATDVDSRGLTFGLSGSGAGQYGTLTVNANGTYSFVPNATAQTLAQGQTAQQSFTYTVTDPQGGTSQATITVNLTGANDAPVAQAATLSTHEDAALVTGNLVATDVDQNSALTYAFAPGEDGQSQWGNLTVNANGGYTFTISQNAQSLNAGQTVTETFSYKVTDQHGATSMNTLTVTISGSADGNLIVGTNCDNNLYGTNAADEIYGKAGEDYITGGDNTDTLIGGQDDDRIYGGNSDDVIYGDDKPVTTPTAPDPTEVIFQGESAGYRNTVGSYEVDANGNITNVSFVFTNASQSGSGGNLTAGESSGMAGAGVNGTFGVFVIADGYSVNNSFNNIDLSQGRLEFRNANGSAATIYSTAPALWFIPNSGSAVQLTGNIYHSAAGMADEGNIALNPDNRIHTQATTDSEGNVQVSFEDLWNLGDNDFNDVILKVMTGESGATLLDANIVDEIPLAGASGANYDTYGGNDSLYGGDGNDTIYAGADNDYVQGDGGSDTLHGEAGDDDLRGGDGNDTVYGGIGNDQLKGGTAQDVLYGGIGNDKLYGEDGDDQLHGEDGTDELYGGTGQDKLYGGAGTDKLRGDSGDDELFGGDGNDDMDGGYDNDKLYAGAGDDLVKGGDGDDQLYGEDGADTMYGGSGHDMIYGGAGNDYIEGDSGNDKIYGGDGADTLKGDDGNDIIVGGMGADRMTGGSGDDIFMYNSAAEGGDTITDFQTGKDTFVFEADGLAGMGGSNTTQNMSNGDFKIIGSGGANLFYDASQDTLSYQSGAGQGYQTIATIESGTVTANDIEII